MGVPTWAVFLLQTRAGLFWWLQAPRGIKDSAKHTRSVSPGICSVLERTPVHLLMYYGQNPMFEFCKIRHAVSPKHRSLYCGPLTQLVCLYQTPVIGHRFLSRCRGTDRETGSKASLWSGLCVVNIHFWYLCEEKSHIPYFKTKPQDKRGNIQRALEDEHSTVLRKCIKKKMY